MDISRWNMNQIMQLPDHCFGERRLIVITTVATGAGATYGISTGALPEWCVLWELAIWMKRTTADEDITQFHWYLRLGDILPTSLAEVVAMDRVFPDQGYFAANRWRFYGPVTWRNLRLPIHSQRRRFVVLLNNDIANNAYISMSLVVSAIPREVPDWLVAGKQQ